jgi:hypothetical protein
MAFTTLADLYRANSDILVQCGRCERYAKLHLFQLAGEPWVSPDMPAHYETLTIAECIVRLRCRKGRSIDPCGGRVSNWTPAVRIHGGMSTG